MKNKDELRDELNELSPFLAKRKGIEEGFKVPKDYFSSLPDEVMKKVLPESPPIVEPQRAWLDGLAEFVQSLFRPRYALAYAMVAVLIVAGIYFIFPAEFDGTSPVVDINEITGEEIEMYLAENIETVSTDLLEEHYVESGAETLPSLELEEVEEYLDDALDDIDLDDLEELL